MKIIVPIAGDTDFKDADYIYPKPLIDINDKPLIEYVTDNLQKLKGENGFVFILKEVLCTQFNLDYTLNQLVVDPVIIKLKSNTKGAVCSVLMAIDKIPMNEEVVIINSDQYFLEDINNAITYFRNENAAGGVITFESVHPRWSFARVDDNSNVLQTAEKRPISKNAIAGFYYFKSFKDFVDGAFVSVFNEDYYDEKIFTSSVINQLILQNKKVKAYKIDNNNFIPFYTPQKVKEFERLVSTKKRLS